MSDIVAWLTAALDTIERDIAQYKEHRERGDHVNYEDQDPAAYDGYDSCSRCVATSRAVAYHDVDFGLRDVAAKRRILDLHGIIWRDIGWLDPDNDEMYEELPVCGICVVKHSHFSDRGAVPVGACRTARLLASVYSDRPGYDPAWAPIDTEASPLSA